MLDFILKNIGPNLVNVNVQENRFCETHNPLFMNDQGQNVYDNKLDNILESIHLYHKDNYDSLLSIFLEEIEDKRIKSLKDFRIQLKDRVNSGNLQNLIPNINNIHGDRINLLIYISKWLNKSIYVKNQDRLIENGDIMLVIEENKWGIWSLKEKTCLQKYKISKKNLNKILVKDLRIIANNLGIDVKNNKNKYLLKTELIDKIKSLL